MRRALVLAVLLAVLPVPARADVCTYDLLGGLYPVEACVRDEGRTGADANTFPCDPSLCVRAEAYGCPGDSVSFEVEVNDGFVGGTVVGCPST